MCLSPNKLKDGTSVACKGCRLCRDNRVNDLIGRCIAEQSTASKTVAVTLTYKGEGPETALLRYKDIQLFLANLRARRGGNYNVRYICAGEYGTKKGRAHWHIILFFYGEAPQVQFEERINWKYWPHGFSYFQNPDYSGFRYVLKYALKAQDDQGAVKALSMSKKPPLGYRFFMNLADDMVEGQFALHTPEYAFAHVRDKNGAARKYWLQGRMRELFIDRYYTMFRMVHKSDPPLTDFFVEKYLDPIARVQIENDPYIFERDKRLRDAQYLASVQSREKHDRESKRHPLGYMLLSHGNSDILTAFSDETAVLEMGDKKWLLTAESVTVAAQLSRAGLPQSKIPLSVLFLEKHWRNHRSLRNS